MKRFLGIFVLLGLFLLAPSAMLAQKRAAKEDFKENHTPFGQRKKEKRNQKGTSNSIAKRGGIFKKKSRSGGNADAFARNSITGGRGFMYKIFHPGSSSQPKNASLRKTRPGRVQDREQHKLFHRLMTPNKGRHERIQSRQRKERSRNRKRGNAVFASPKR
jgi:hypothetical protein